MVSSQEQKSLTPNEWLVVLVYIGCTLMWILPAICEIDEGDEGQAVYECTKNLVFLVVCMVALVSLLLWYASAPWWLFLLGNAAVYLVHGVVFMRVMSQT